MTNDLRKRFDTTVKAIGVYFYLTHSGTDDELAERKRIFSALTDHELDRIVTKRRLQEGSICERIATELKVPVEEVSEELAHLKLSVDCGRSIFLSMFPDSDVCKADNKSQKPAWLITDERALVGTWMNTDQDTRSVPKIEVFFEDEELRIRIWGRTHPVDTPYGKPEPLHVLSRGKGADAVAFNVHRADFAMNYHTLKLTGDKLNFDGVTIFTDSSGRSNRIDQLTFARAKAGANDDVEQ